MQSAHNQQHSEIIPNFRRHCCQHFSITWFWTALVMKLGTTLERTTTESQAPWLHMKMLTATGYRWDQKSSPKQSLPSRQEHLSRMVTERSWPTMGLATRRGWTTTATPRSSSPPRTLPRGSPAGRTMPGSSRWTGGLSLLSSLSTAVALKHIMHDLFEALSVSFIGNLPLLWNMQG